MGIWAVNLFIVIRTFVQHFRDRSGDRVIAASWTTTRRGPSARIHGVCARAALGSAYGLDRVARPFVGLDESLGSLPIFIGFAKIRHEHVPDAVRCAVLRGVRYEDPKEKHNPATVQNGKSRDLLTNFVRKHVSNHQNTSGEIWRSTVTNEMPSPEGSAGNLLAGLRKTRPSPLELGSRKRSCGGRRQNSLHDLLRVRFF